MSTEIKVQIIFATLLSLELLGLFMIIIRTTANLEHAFGRIEKIVHMEIRVSLKAKDHERIVKEKVKAQGLNKGKKNELLLNIPFMDRLNKDKEKGHG